MGQLHDVLGGIFIVPAVILQWRASEVGETRCVISGVTFTVAGSYSALTETVVSADTHVGMRCTMDVNGVVGILWGDLHEGT